MKKCMHIVYTRFSFPVAIQVCCQLLLSLQLLLMSFMFSAQYFWKITFDYCIYGTGTYTKVVC